MSEWWCIVSGNGYSGIPVAFQTTVNRGNKITGAAWRKGSGQTFLIAIGAVLPPETNETQAKNKLQKKFIPNETLGKTLPLCSKFKVENVRQASSSFFQYFNQQGFQVIRPTASEAIVLVSPITSISDAESGICHYTVLGLQPGAAESEIKNAARVLMKLYHPDKSHGDTSKFCLIHDAMMALTGGVPHTNANSERQIVVAPKQDKTYEDMTIAELDKLFRESTVYTIALTNEIKRANAVQYQIRDALKKKHAEANRSKAIEMTNQFRMSAKYWDGVQLKAWFQPDRFKNDAQEENGWDRKLEELYGSPYLRKGNEDLDPYIIFERFWTQGPEFGNKSLLIRIGFDRIDAVDNGHTLIVPFAQFWKREYPSYTRLLQQGFDMKLADEMLEANVWMHLYAAKLIDNPKHGVSLDVKTAWAQYEHINFSTDPHGAKAHCMQDIARASRQEREKRENREERRDDNFWQGKKPKNLQQLREFFKQKVGEPEPEAVEDDPYYDDSQDMTSSDSSDSKKRRML